MSVQVLVVPRKTAGLKGDPKAFGTPRIFPLMSLDEALTLDFDYDAHVTAYRIEGDDRCPRINKTGYQFIADAGHRVVADYIFVDVDNPNHAPWDSEQQIEAALHKVRATVLGSNAGFYATRHGYRLFWRLGATLDVRFFESLATQLVRALSAEGIDADAACTDWTRLFRLPHATPEGLSRPIRLPAYLEHGVLAFNPTLSESRMPTLLEGVGHDWSSAPPSVTPPSACPDVVALLATDKVLHDRASKGKPLAEPGNRINTIKRAVGIITKKMQDPTPEAVFGALSWSVAADTRGNGNGGAPTLDELWSICKSTCAKELTERAQTARVVAGLGSIARKRERNRALAEGLTPPEEPEEPLFGQTEEAFGPSASGGAGSTGGGSSKIIPVERHAVILTKTSGCYYVLDEEESNKRGSYLYRGPFDATSLPAMLEKYAPAVTDGGIKIRTDKGKLHAVNEILTRFGHEADSIISVIGKRGIEFDLATNTLIEGVGALREDLVPTYDPEIAMWLAIFGGKHVDQLLDWLATFTELGAPTCGLYLHSAGGTGKGLFTSGLSRLWGTAPTMYANIIETHNDAIAKCPLVWADEEIPASKHGKTPSAVFRTLVGNSDFNLRRMYSPASTIRGCLRFVLTANNINALKINEDLSIDDLNAITERIGYIQIPDAARDYLRKIGGRQKTQAWVDGDGIAKHVLWLRANRQVARGERFLVEGWQSDLTKSLKASAGRASNVVEVIAHAVAQKVAKIGSSASAWDTTFPQFDVGNRYVYCTISGIYDAWETVLGAKAEAAKKASISRALSQLAATQDLVRIERKVGFKTEKMKMWAIRPEAVLDIIEKYQLGDTDAVRNEIMTRILRIC
jgi:hypothetical protein